MGLLLSLEATLCMELDLEELRASGQPPPAVDPLVLLVGPCVAEVRALEPSLLKPSAISDYALGIASLLVLEGESDCVFDFRERFAICDIRTCTKVRFHLFVEAVFAFETVVEADQLAGRVGRLDAAHRGRDNVLFYFPDASTALFDRVVAILSVDGGAVGLRSRDVGDIR